MALVTGGDSGIGRSVCRYFVLEGATVAFTHVKSEEDKDADATLKMLMEDKKSINSGAKDPIAIPADLGLEENCKRVVDEVVKTYGHIDILVNNAAEQYVHINIEEISDEQLKRVFATNMFSYFYVTK